jgi:hypothetical protein
MHIGKCPCGDFNGSAARANVLRKRIGSRRHILKPRIGQRTVPHARQSHIRVCRSPPEELIEKHMAIRMLRVAWEASYRAGTAALARRQLVAAAVAWRGRCRLSRAGVLLADADHPDLALGRLGPEPRPHCHIVRIQRGRRRCRFALVAGAERPRQHHRRRRSLFRSYWAASFPWRSAQASCLPARWVRIGWSGPQLSDCSPSAPPDFIGR